MRLILFVLTVYFIYYSTCKPSSGFDYYNAISGRKVKEECMKPVKEQPGWWECTKYKSSWFDEIEIGLDYCAIKISTTIEGGLYECRKYSPLVTEII